jgi:hypothetical protein
MKRAILSFVLLIWVFTSRGVADTLTNRGFEAGDLSGWLPRMDLGLLGFPRGGRPPGLYPIVPGMVVTNFPLEGLDPILPHAGNYFLAFEIGGQGILVDNSQSYTSAVNATLFFNLGDTLSGWASFADGDYVPQDSAWVKVFDDTGALVATPFQAVSGNNPDLTPRIVTPWTLWQWQAPASGMYTVQLGAATVGDNLDPSETFFDDLNFNAVPEPNVGVLALLTLTLLLRKRGAGRME